MKTSSIVWVVLLTALASSQLDGQVSVTTQHNDPWRTGQNTQETSLTTAINKNNFGLLCKIRLLSTPQQEQAYGQPLVVWNNNGTMTVYIATMQDNVYAFSVPIAWNNQTCTQLQGTAPVLLLRGGLAGQHPADACFIGKGFRGTDCSTRAICPSVGVLGTPVIDSASSTMYLVTESQDTDTGQQGTNCTKAPPTTWYHYLHALDLTSSSLAEKNSGPKLIAPSQIGTAIFDSQQLLQRPGLLFLPPGTSPTSPTVYAAFSMMDGTSPNPSGWVLAYDGGNLGLGGFPLAYATTSGLGDANRRHGGGVWMGGGGLPAGLDGNNNNSIYLTTADGQFDNPLATNGNAGNSFLKLTTDLQVSNYFTPSDQFYRWDTSCGTKDMDLGSGGVGLIPDGIPTSGAHLAVNGDKEGAIWVVDRTNPGGYGGPVIVGCAQYRTDGNVQTLRPVVNMTYHALFHNSPAYWNSALYFAGAQTDAPNSPWCKFGFVTTKC